jgi:hypothetical protein
MTFNEETIMSYPSDCLQDDKGYDKHVWLVAIQIKSSAFYPHKPMYMLKISCPDKT